MSCRKTGNLTLVLRLQSKGSMGLPWCNYRYGPPNVEAMPKIVTGENVEDQFQADLKSEQSAIVSYNEGIATRRQAGDTGLWGPHGTGAEDTAAAN